MAEQTAKIKVRVEDNTPEGFRKVERSLREFGSNLKSLEGRVNIFDGLRTGALALGAALGGGQLAAAFNAAVDAADELNAVSVRTGIAVESLSELKFAAEQANLSFSDLQIGLKAFGKSIVENSEGFKQLGLDPSQFKDFDDALEKTADQFAKVNDDFAATKLSLELFGKSGNSFIEFLRLGSAGIIGFREEARKLNAVISSDFAKAADEYNDNIRKIGAAWEALKTRMASSILPFLGQAAEELLVAIKAAGSLSGALKLAATTSPGLDPAQKIRDTEEEVRRLEQRIQELDLQNAGEFDVSGQGLSQLKNLNDALKTTRTELEYLRGLRDIEIRADPKLKALAETGRGIRENTNITNAATLRVPSAEDNKPSRNARATSPFDSLRSSLESQLVRERNLTVELALAEDQRFQSLLPKQQAQLRVIAQRIDAIKLEKTQTEAVEQSISVERSLRETATQDEIANIEVRKSVLTREYEDRKLSAQEYYAFIAAEETRINAIQIGSLERDAQDETRVASDTARPINERFQAITREAEIRAQVAQLTREQAEIEQRNARAAAAADEATLDRKAQIAQQLNSLRGSPDLELDKLVLERQFQDLPDEFKATVTFQTFLDTTIAEQQIQEFERRVRVIESQRQVREESATISRQSGSLNQGEFQSAISEIRRDAVDKINDEIAALEALRDANEIVFGEEQLTRIQALKNEVDSLNLTTDEYLNTIKDVSQNEFSDLFNDIISGSERADVALKKFGQSIQANLNRRVANELTDNLFGGIQNATKESGGLAGLVESGFGAAASFLGFGKQKSPTLDEFGGSGVLRDNTNFGVDVLSGIGGGNDAAPAIDAFAEAATKGATAVLGLGDSAAQSDTSVIGLSGALETAVPSVAEKLTGLVSSTAIADTGTSNLGTELLVASVAVRAFADAAFEATIRLAASSVASADGNVFSGGYHVPFARGGLFEHGAVQAFATGGVVSSPTLFPMAGGQTGLMGEAGSEAIMPLTKASGAFQVYAITADGAQTAVDVTRNAAGQMAVALPDVAASASPPALSGSSDPGARNLSMQFADGGVVSSAANYAYSVAAQTFYGDAQSTDASVKSILNSAQATALNFAEHSSIEKNVQAFASGGIVSRPTTFPIRGGKTGLMGEAGPEAIMPLTRTGGAFQVYAIAEDGTNTTLAISRNAAGKLAVQLPSQRAADAQFALGGVTQGAPDKYIMKFADGGVFTSLSNSVAIGMTALSARADAVPIRAYMYGGVARSPQVAVFGEGARPEAFVPLPDGRSIPVTMDAQMQQGITVVQNITTPDANSFRRSRAALFNDVQSGLSAAASKN